MNKKRKICIFVLTAIVAAILTSASIASKQNAFADSKSDAARAIIGDIDNISISAMKNVKTASDYYISLFNKEHSSEKPIAFENDDFFFLFDKDAVNVKLIFAKQEIPIFEPIDGEDSAIKNAELLAFSACPNLFPLKAYDVFCDINTEPGAYSNTVYTVEFWEKVSDGFYTGNKISMLISDDGCLNLFLSASSNSEYALEKMNNGDPHVLDEMLTEKKAIEIAYSEIDRIARDLVNPIEGSETVKPGGNSSSSDSGVIVDYTQLPKLDNHKIFTQERDEHIVRAYIRLQNNNPKWDIVVDGIKTTMPWWETISFHVVIDGTTGNIELVDHTR
ncbi:MAG: hypothetical protein FWG30_09580 [Eubacteriaceae bacterium]|nr:hypothetical protein [Eubacteriaceae bacterium]